MAESDPPLAGKTILLTRPEQRARALAEALRELGADVDARATIELVRPLDEGPARRAVAAVESFQWMIFTSVNGVRFFDELLRELQGTRSRILPSVAVIGPATAREAEAAGYRVSLVAQESSSEGLARALSARIPRGARVLVVRPEVARPLVPQALNEIGAVAEVVAFYRNRPSADVGEVAASVVEGRYDVVLLSSPSSLERLVEACSGERQRVVDALTRCRIVALGPVTARAVERHGLRCAAVAERPTDEAVLRCLAQIF